MYFMIKENQICDLQVLKMIMFLSDGNFGLRRTYCLPYTLSYISHNTKTCYNKYVILSLLRRMISKFALCTS